MAKHEMPLRTLGRTGEEVSALGLGGWHLGLKHVDSSLADRIMRTAADKGMNFFDNSWDYNDGESERRMGRVLQDGYRTKIFLMTKINGRTKKEATTQLDESLKRLRVDMIDLVQHHEVIRFEDPDRIFAEDGAAPRNTSPVSGWRGSVSGSATSKFVSWLSDVLCMFTRCRSIQMLPPAARV